MEVLVLLGQHNSIPMFRLESLDLLQELHTSNFHLQNPSHLQRLAVTKYPPELWHSDPCNPTDPVGEYDAADHIEVADGKVLGNFARDAIAKAGGNRREHV